MLNVWMSVLISIAADPEPLGEEGFEMSLAAEPEGDDAVSEPDDEAEPRQWSCKYGDELDDFNYCLARCSSRLYEILGYPIEEDRWNRDFCKSEAKTFCRNLGRSFRGWCWG